MYVGILPVYDCAPLLGTYEVQKKVSDLERLESQTVLDSSNGCWELNLGPLEEQLVVLTTKPPFYPHNCFC